MIEDKRPITNKGEYDVVVVGGGIAGAAAAVAAARRGVSVLLAEKSINLGGLATTGLIAWYEPLCDGCGKKMIGGLAEELIKLAAKFGFDNIPPKWGGESGNGHRNDRYSTFFSPTIFSLALDEFLTDAGVDIRFDTQAVYPIMNGAKCDGILFESISGREYFKCKAVIDATGTAAVCHAAGMPTVNGENYLTYAAHYVDKTNAAAFAEDGDMARFRSWFSVGSDMEGNRHPSGMTKVSGTTSDEVNMFIKAGKKLAFERVKTRNRLEFDLSAIPYMPQFRTVRRIEGDIEFKAEDGKEFADNIGCCGDFRPKGYGKHYQVPYRALYNSEFDNILAAGRIISAPYGDGWEVSRVIPVCALTGEAAGNAAALIVKDKCTAATTDIRKLQRLQADNGIMINYGG